MSTRLSKDKLIEFEEGIKDLFLEGKIRFPCHLSGGNEEDLIEIFEEFRDGDWVFSTHRNHYHALLSYFTPGELRDYIVSKGSMHVYKERFFTSGIVGGILPIALGVAMGIKLNRSKEKVWCFVGDMAGMTGIFSECYAYACGHELPVTFVIENNGYSVDTPTFEAWGNVSREGDVRILEYKRKWPHQGAGDYVIF